ncbi:MAG: hypothetical protein RRX88_04640 [Raoultibacter sp.]
MKVRDKQQSQSGNVVIFTAVLLTILMIFAALAVDAASFLGQHSRQTNITQIAKEAQSDAATMMKYSNTPGGDISRYMVDIIRANGFTGKIDVYYFELGSRDLTIEQATSNRYFAYKVALTDSYKTQFARIIGISEVEITTDLLGLGHPYSNAAVWRPNHLDNGVFTSQASATTPDLKFSPLVNISDLPLDMAASLNQLKKQD